MVKYDEIDRGKSGAIDKSVKKFSKMSRNYQKVRKTWKGWKVTKVISSEERLLKHWSFINA